MFEDVAVEHVFAHMIRELQLQLESLAGADAPGLLHCFVRIAGPSVTAEALLIDVVNVHHVGSPGRICENPLLGGAQNWAGVDPVGIEDQTVDRPMV